MQILDCIRRNTAKKKEENLLPTLNMTYLTAQIKGPMKFF